MNVEGIDLCDAQPWVYLMVDGREEVQVVLGGDEHGNERNDNIGSDDGS